MTGLDLGVCLIVLDLKLGINVLTTYVLLFVAMEELYHQNHVTMDLNHIFLLTELLDVYLTVQIPILIGHVQEGTSIQELAVLQNAATLFLMLWSFVTMELLQDVCRTVLGHQQDTNVRTIFAPQYVETEGSLLLKYATMGLLIILLLF